MAKKIDTSTIQGYSEMTAEQKLAILEAYEFEDNSNEVERLKNTISKANSEAAEWKRKHNDLLSEEERKQAEFDENQKALHEELERYRKSDRVNKHKLSLMGNGFNEQMASEAAIALENGDNETFYKVQKSHLELVAKQLEEKLMNSTPEPAKGVGGTVMTKAKFLQLGVEEQAEYIQNNPNWKNELK